MYCMCLQCNFVDLLPHHRPDNNIQATRSPDVWILLLSQMCYMSYHSQSWSRCDCLLLHWQLGINCEVEFMKGTSWGHWVDTSITVWANAKSVEGLTQHQSVATRMTNPWSVSLVSQQSKTFSCPSMERKAWHCKTITGGLGMTLHWCALFSYNWTSLLMLHIVEYGQWRCLCCCLVCCLLCIWCQHTHTTGTDHAMSLHCPGCSDASGWLILDLKEALL